MKEALDCGLRMLNVSVVCCCVLVVCSILVQCSCSMCSMLYVPGTWYTSSSTTILVRCKASCLESKSIVTCDVMM